MKRLIVSAPETVKLELLTTEQQAAIQSVFTQYVLPMPGTIPYLNNILIDAIVNDNFDPLAITQLNLPFIIIGLWQWDGISTQVNIIQLDQATLLAHLPPTRIYDHITGDILSENPAILHEPHRFGGWPPISFQ